MSSAANSGDGRPTGDAPAVLVWVCGAVCIGVMMNVTVIVPVSLAVTNSLANSSFVVSAYAFGALLGLPLFQRAGHRSVRLAVLTHASLMCVGNVCFWLTSRADSLGGLVFSRLVLGFEGGVMYNANLALLDYSHPTKHVKYLSLYQAFVGGGLILGPCLSSVALVVGRALGLDRDNSASLASLILSAFGLVLFLFVWFRLPEAKQLRALAAAQPSDGLQLQDDLGAGADAAEEPSKPEALLSATPQERKWQWYMAAGNFLRLAQRLTWEAGAIILFVERYQWGLVLGGLSLAVGGAAQTYSQVLYAKLDPKPDNRIAIKYLELLELAGIVMMVGANKPQTVYAKVFFEFMFCVGSVAFSVANCLSAAPYNSFVLKSRAAMVAPTNGRDGLLLMTQAGIFLGMLVGPIIARVTMAKVGINQSTLAAVLLCGWAAQKLLTAVVLRVTTAPVSVAFSVAAVFLVLIFMLNTKLGGTGADNKFSYHPIFMAAGFIGFMHMGQGESKEWLMTAVVDPSGQLSDEAKATRKRQVHAACMALATVCSVVGYFCIFAAHEENGESQIGEDTGNGRAAHVAFGYTCLAWMTLQTGVGVVKMVKVTAVPPVKAHRWHGDSGKYLLCLGLLTCVIGFWVRMNFDGHGWPGSIQIALTALAVFLACTRWLPALPPGEPLLAPADAPASTTDNEMVRPGA